MFDSAPQPPEGGAIQPQLAPPSGGWGAEQPELILYPSAEINPSICRIFAENNAFIYRNILNELWPYTYHQKDWTNFTWDDAATQVLFGKVRNLQGKIAGQMSTLGFSTKAETKLTTLTLDVVKSSEIEGETLNYEQVRSSIARRLGINVAGLIPTDRNVEGVVDMMLDATQNYLNPLTEDRLFGWHSALFGLSSFIPSMMGMAG